MKRSGSIGGVIAGGAALLLLCAGVAWAGPNPGTGIAGSAHDFSSQLSWNPTAQTCGVCHTPHAANTGVTASPLWNRRSTTATFTVYTSPTLTATVSQPDGNSKLCLSCHDGTVGLESFGSAGSSVDAWADPPVGTSFIANGVRVGTTLSNDHPISFTYDAALATADGGLATPVSASFVDATSSVPLFAGRVQCGSCHDVHNSVGKTAARPLLRVSNAGSALCLRCHAK